MRAEAGWSPGPLAPSFQLRSTAGFRTEGVELPGARPASPGPAGPFRPLPQPAHRPATCSPARRGGAAVPLPVPMATRGPTGRPGLPAAAQPIWPQSRPSWAARGPGGRGALTALQRPETRVGAPGVRQLLVPAPGLAAGLTLMGQKPPSPWGSHILERHSPPPRPQVSTQCGGRNQPSIRERPAFLSQPPGLKSPSSVTLGNLLNLSLL